MQKISKFILSLFGWKITGSFSKDIKKCVLVIAPHTSNWDFVIGRLAFWILKLDVKFLIKQEFFKFPIKRIILGLGGVPVNRTKSSNVVSSTVEMFDKSEALIITITPEGTRSLVKNWKKGFYYVATQAKVPLVLGFLDYKKKEAGIGPLIYPSGNYKEDFEKIEEFYKGKNARFPEQFNLTSKENNSEN
ncbi:MAG: lysophospholipid acyltransferase family protein [Saprospiraceae bacterium]|nr:lysophospholipid acyltransferase family protein [Saprospiraceae bacterium]